MLQGGDHRRVHLSVIADRSDGFQCHVAARDRPFVVLFQHKRANEANDGGLIGEDPDHIGAALDFLVEPFQRVGGMDFRLEQIASEWARESALSYCNLDSDWGEGPHKPVKTDSVLTEFALE